MFLGIWRDRWLGIEIQVDRDQDGPPVYVYDPGHAWSRCVERLTNREFEAALDHYRQCTDRYPPTPGQFAAEGRAIARASARNPRASQLPQQPDPSPEAQSFRAFMSRLAAVLVRNYARRQGAREAVSVDESPVHGCDVYGCALEALAHTTLSPRAVRQENEVEVDGRPMRTVSWSVLGGPDDMTRLRRIHGRYWRERAPQ